MQLSQFSPKLLAAGAALCLAVIATPAMATFTAVTDTNISYTGTVTDPNGNAHAIIPYTSTPGTTTYGGRDLSLYAGNDTSGVNSTYILTNWYSSINGNNDGAGNPNNANSGFVQLVDLTNTNPTSMSGGWTDSTYTTFTMSISSNGPATSDNSRLWAAPNTGGAANTTGGQFQNYTFYLTATFAPGDVTEESPNWFSTSAAPTTVTGSFSGIFDNTGTLAPGHYSFDFSFLDTSWAGSNGLGGADGVYFAGSAVSPVAVPEPPTLILFGLFGAAALGLASRARRKRVG